MVLNIEMCTKMCQLLNFILGQSKMSIYVSREKVGEGVDVMWFYC